MFLIVLKMTGQLEIAARDLSHDICCEMGVEASSPFPHIAKKKHGN